MTKATSSRGWRIEHIIAAGVASLVALVVIFDPETSPFFPPCLFRAATGWLCPGCGAARAVHALVHGHLGAALALNPLAVVTVPLAGTDLIQRLRGEPGLPTHRIPARYLMAAAVALALYAVLRNI